MILDTRLSFNDHVKEITAWTNETIGLLIKLQNDLPRPDLLYLKSVLNPT